MGFLPGIHVVPGGRVDPPDVEPVDSDEVPHPAVAAALRGGGSKRPPVAFLNAALRETLEETGLLVGRPLVALAAEAMTAPATELARAYRAAGLAPGYARFDYLCRAITPVTSRRRFNTRFFLADGDDASGQLGGNGELEDLRWQPAARLDELTLVDVTEYVLKVALERWRNRVHVGLMPAKILNYRNNIMMLSSQRRSRN
jgi:8-oxo-dGTP pyrophosphatase MutT (NUDIX family)